MILDPGYAEELFNPTLYGVGVLFVLLALWLFWSPSSRGAQS
jgi:hypothetical protein